MLVAKLSNVSESLTSNWFWRHSGVMENSWSLALWEASRGHQWKCSLSCGGNPKTEGAMEGGWGSAPYVSVRVPEERPGGYVKVQLLEPPADADVRMVRPLPVRAEAVEWSWPEPMSWVELCVLEMSELKKWSCIESLEPRRSWVPGPGDWVICMVGV